MAWPTTSRHARGYGTAWTKLREQVLIRDKHLCQPCLRKGKVHPGTEVDHKKPKSQGGTDDLDNLELTCAAAHRDKTVRENGGKPRRRIGADGWPIED